jgi:putative FmdB family regulatory protein
MPVYEYICKACDHEFEREQRISDNPLKKCPECGAMKAKRLISRTSFVLKGGGWYSDLYSSTRGDSAKSESDDSAKSESGDSAKSESSAESTSKPDSSSKSESSSSSKPSSGKKSDSSKGSRAAA